LWFIDEKLVAALSVNEPAQPSSKPKKPSNGTAEVSVVDEELLTALFENRPLPTPGKPAFPSAPPAAAIPQPQTVPAAPVPAPIQVQPSQAAEPDPPFAPVVVPARSTAWSLFEEKHRTPAPQTHHTTPFIVPEQMPGLPRLDTAVQSQANELSADQAMSDQAAAQFRARQYNEALRVYRELARKQPDDPTPAYNVAVCLRQLGRYSEAAQSFEKTLELLPGHPDAHVGLSWCLLHLRKPEAALGMFDQQLLHTPGDVHALQGRAQALQLLNRHAEARDAYLQLLPADPANPDLLSNLIAIAAAEHDVPALHSHSSALIEVRSRSRQALVGLATAYLAEGNLHEALAETTRFLEVEPRSYEGWFNTALAAEKLADFPQAEKAFREALQLSPARIEPRIGLARLHLHRNDPAGAKALYFEILSQNPAEPSCLWNLGLIAERQELFLEAETYFAKLAAIAPDHPTAMLHLGYVRLRLGNTPSSIAALERCAAARPNWADPHIYLGLAQWTMGDTWSAALHLDRALSIHPGHPVALQARTALALETGDLSIAPELEAQLADLGHTLPEFCYRLGILQYSAGQYDAAVHSYRRAVGKKPTFADALVNLGCTLEKMGKRDQAREILQNALSVKPELAAEYFQTRAAS
jgi:tetratricopeptide (TPR) repeat protein